MNSPPHASHLSGDRLVTPWLTVFDTKKLRKIPFLDVELRRAGEELLGVSAKVRKSVGTKAGYSQRPLKALHSTRGSPRYVYIPDITSPPLHVPPPFLPPHQIIDVPPAYERSHAPLVYQYMDATTWPKHLMIQYR